MTRLFLNISIFAGRTCRKRLLSKGNEEKQPLELSIEK